MENLKYKRIAVWSVLAFGVGVLITAVIPSGRQAVRAWFDRGYTREVLATAEGDALNDGRLMKVIKYKGPQSIFIEVVEVRDPSHLVARLVLPDKHDGYFNLRGHVTRLAIADIDDDGKKELLIPTFDHQLVPHLNIYRYSPETRAFEPLKAP